MMPTAMEVSELDLRYLKRESRLGEEGPDILPDLVPNTFTPDEAERFRSSLSLVACGPEESLLDRSWRLQEALKEEGMISPEWKGKDRTELL
jgi:hypothetical protein